ncbi:hypothetical protein ACLK1S_23215 [Escherichia coli]
MTRQAVRLGILLPMRIIHTSEMESGQSYSVCELDVMSRS